MNIVKRKLSELKISEKNIRLHPEKQIKEYERSIKKNGQLKLFVIDENNVIWIGNGLYEAMLRCGIEESYCILKEGMTEKDKKKMMMADNRVFNLGVDDMSVFDDFLKEFEGELDIPGYDEEFLRSLISDADETTEILSEYGKLDDEDVERIKSAKTAVEPSMEYERAETLPTELTAVATGADSAQRDREESSEVRKSVKCPHCGELIWL